MPGKRKYTKNEAGLYQCSECDYTTAKSSTLCMHLNKHDEKRQNKCKYCDKVFIEKQTLEKHLMNFSGKADHPELRGADQFECPHLTCEFSSSNRGNCRTHFMRVHASKEANALLERTGDAIRCKTCHNTFTSLGSFYYHSIGCISLPIEDARHGLMAELS